MTDQRIDVVIGRLDTNLVEKSLFALSPFLQAAL